MADIPHVEDREALPETLMRGSHDQTGVEMEGPSVSSLLTETAAIPDQPSSLVSQDHAPSALMVDPDVESTVEPAAVLDPPSTEVDQGPPESLEVAEHGVVSEIAPDTVATVEGATTQETSHIEAAPDDVIMQETSLTEAAPDDIVEHASDPGLPPQPREGEPGPSGAPPSGRVSIPFDFSVLVS